MTAYDVVRLLGLEPLPDEGGFFRRTWTSPVHVHENAWQGVRPGFYQGSRAAGTAIYGLFTRTDFSALHRLKTDETWHYYAGDPIQLVMLSPDSKLERVVLGSDLLNGHRPQVTVPARWWQGGGPLPTSDGVGWSLVGCTMCPGFDWSDFELGHRAMLRSQYPDAVEWVDRFTRESSPRADSLFRSAVHAHSK